MAHLAGCPLKDVECECIWMHQDKEFTCEGCSCVCPELKIGRNSTLNDAADAVERYADETHLPHSRFTTCLRCDITAALYVAAQRVRELTTEEEEKEEPTPKFKWVEDNGLIGHWEATPEVKPCSTCGEPVAYLTARPGWAGGWLHHPARPLDGHPAAIDGEATPQDECKHTHVQPYTQSDQRPWCVSCGLFVTVIGKEAGR